VYEGNVFTRNTVEEVDFLLQTLKLAPGSSVLDVGCGTGRHTIELARRGYQVTGVDISMGMLNVAEENARNAGVQVNLQLADAASYAPKEFYDAVICLCEGAFGLLGSQDDPVEQPLSILHMASAAMKPGAYCLFTVLNGFRMIRLHQQADVIQGRFDLLSLTEVSDCEIPGGDSSKTLRERGFLPTELRLMFETTGLQVLNIWGGTAGQWGQRGIELDEMEIMVCAQKPVASG
jgi:cyclopropane fatty-acyl-phospholipid synthase-like methyltransferase